MLGKYGTRKIIPPLEAHTHTHTTISLIEEANERERNKKKTSNSQSEIININPKIEAFVVGKPKMYANRKRKR